MAPPVMKKASSEQNVNFSKELLSMFQKSEWYGRSVKSKMCENLLPWSVFPLYTLCKYQYHILVTKNTYIFSLSLILQISEGFMADMGELFIP